MKSCYDFSVTGEMEHTNMQAHDNTVVDTIELPNESKNFFPSGATVGICDAFSPDLLLEYVADHALSHIVQKSGLQFDCEIKLAALMVNHPDRYLSFPISSILRPNDAGDNTERELTPLRIKCSTIVEKETIITPVLEHFSHQLNATILDDIRVVIDELLSNATSHGPRKRHGSIDYDGQGFEVQNSQRLFIDPSYLSVGYDSDRLVINCQDAYGALDPAELVIRLRKCSLNGIASVINLGPGSAGVGTYEIFRASAALYIGVDPGRKTSISITMPMRGSSTAREAIPKNLHIFLGQP